MSQKIRSVTLLELLVGLALLSIIILIVSSFDLYTNQQVIGSERRAMLQNEVSYILDHMAREINRAIGNESVNGANSVVNPDNIGANQAIRIYIDANGNGRREVAAGTDFWIAYRFTDNAGPPVNRFQIRFCPRCTTPACAACAAPNAWGTAANILSRRIEDLNIAGVTDGDVLVNNSIDITLTACWDPSQALGFGACGTPANPQVNMRATMFMPSVSTN
ncbi:MAG: hypothetical protein FJZ13_00685 [Candidatus Omnitrophica bacterium]|nr:hypothetical protein [Candidatus Omnitrophota bacterium]